MKPINRAKLRGKPLERECYRANTCVEDNEVRCWGLYAEFSDDEIGDVAEKCLNCKAYVRWEGDEDDL